MGTPVKIAVIGAGSATFSLALVKDLCLTPGLADCLVSFMDIDAVRLEMIHKLAGRYAQELGANLRFERTTERRAALRDADFVINTASVVPYQDGLAVRERITQHGYYWGGGPAAGEYAFYNIRFMLDVAHEMEAICPDAWLIQAGNPVFEGCTAMTRQTNIKVCGLCHGHYGYRDICQLIGIDPHKVLWQAPGLNHNIWLTHFFYEGQDAYPLIDRWIEEQGEAYWHDNSPTRPLPPGKLWTPELERAWEIDLSRAAAHMYQMFGLMPIGDTVWMQYVGWWYHQELAAKRFWFGEPWGGQMTELSWPMYVQNLERRIEQIARLAQDPQASLVEALGATKTHEQHVPIIDGLVNDHEGQFQVNVPNQGALQGVPDDVVVEVPALVNKKGIQPLCVGALPPKIMVEQILPHWLSMERTLLAIQTGDRSILLWKILDHHATRSYQQAEALLDELLSLEVHQEMNDYFRWPQQWRSSVAQRPAPQPEPSPA
jgi:alpha-galactosidase